MIIDWREILPSDQSRIKEQAKFTYLRLRKASEKQTKTIEEQGEKQIKAIETRVQKQLLDADQKLIVSIILKDSLNCRNRK